MLIKSRSCCIATKAASILFNKGDWDETENREDERFLEVEREIWEEMHPNLELDDESDEEAEEEEEEDGESDSQNSNGSDSVM